MRLVLDAATDTVVRIGSVLARAAHAGEADVLANVLRRDFRWRAVGLAEPPDVTFLSRPVDVCWPVTQEVRIEAVVMLGGPRLVAALVHWGWEAGDGRLRIAEMVALEVGPAQSAARAAVAVLAAERVRALRMPEGGALAAFWAESGAPLVQAAGRWFRHLDHEALRRVVAVSPAAQGPRVELAAGERQRFSALRDRPAAPARFPITVRDPSQAHCQLVRGGWPQRAFFFPRAESVEDHDIIVVGGGLAGLAAAYALRDREVLLLEREDRLGGTAAAEDGLRTRFSLGAHYDCDPSTGFSVDLLTLYRDLAVTRQVGGAHRFIDEQHYVPEERSEQAVSADGGVRRDGWRRFYREPEAMHLRELMVAHMGDYPLPSRQAPPRAKALQAQTFRAWCDAHGVVRNPELRRGLSVLLRSDYGAPDDTVSAFAGIHYFACRPYLTTGTRTFSPPEGLMYFAERLLAATPRLQVRTQHMVRKLADRGDHVEVTCLDLAARRTRMFRARGVVFAAPKKALPYIFPPDRRLFARNRYAAWITVTLELADLPERDLLCWSNHVYERTARYVGFTWANRHTPEAPPVLSHYLAFPPGRAEHVRALLAEPRRLVRFCLRQLAALVGRDVGALVERATVQKLGHAMPVPVPGALFYEPNARRHARRIVYAGVDTGRLPLLAEALDSGMEAARMLAEATERSP